MLTSFRYTTLRTKEEVHSLLVKSDERSEILFAFTNLSLVNGKLSIDPAMPVLRGARTIRTWLGHVLEDEHSDDYVNLRHQLSEASFYGDWDVLFAILERGLSEYGELWANAPRLR